MRSRKVLLVSLLLSVAFSWSQTGTSTIRGTVGTVTGTQGRVVPSSAPKLFGSCGTDKVYQSFRNAYPGEIGPRNYLRYPGYVDLDMGLSKARKMPYNEKPPASSSLGRHQHAEAVRDCGFRGCAV
jgi:hypothetical protein